MPPIIPILQRSPVMVAPSLPSDPVLRTIADDVIAQFCYSCAHVAVEEQPTASGRLDVMFRNLLNTRNSLTRTNMREQARTLLNAPLPVRTKDLGRYSTIAAQEYKMIGSDGLAGRVGQLQLQQAAVEESLKKYHSQLANMMNASPDVALAAQGANVAHGGQAAIQLDADLIAGLTFRKLRLYITEVRCIEETNEWGSDEINLGGAATTPLGKTTMINQFEVSDDFDEGEKVTFGMNQVFTTWNLETEASGFPYVYAAIIAMAEKDDGGFYQFLKDLWEKVDYTVKKMVAGLVGAEIGAALGAGFGPLGAAIGALIGAIVGFLVEWVIKWFHNADDIVNVLPVLMTLASPKKSYYDWAKLTTAKGCSTTLHFKGDGGHYEVDIAYKVLKP